MRLTYRGKEKDKAYCDYDTRDIINRLADYEDAEEQGLLLKLPCRVGDTVYHIEDGYIYEFKARKTENTSFALILWTTRQKILAELYF